ncbi:MAG TPA: phosphodiester glycosidase family protein [Trebonia sp.]|nr:phosphodiester glycosidase family protein [Trebonia sp.]
MRRKAPVHAWRTRAAVAAGLAALGLAGLQSGPALAAPGAATGSGHGATAGAASWLPATPANWPLVVDSSRTPAQTITSGVTQYSQTLDTVAGRQHAQVLNVDLASKNVAVRTVEAGNAVIDPADETVKSMGTRTGAVAGINGGYFDINATGQPTGGSVVNGQIYKSPPVGYNAELSVLANGTMKIGQENFSGTITDGSATEPLTSVNIPADAAAGKVTEVTPALATSAQSLTAAATLVSGTLTGTGGSQTLTVTSVQAGVKSLPVPAAGTAGLLGSGAGGTWLADNVHVGDAVTLTEGFGADDVTQLITAPTQLIKDGQAYADPTGQPPSGVNPETAVGISSDGKHAIFVTLDGELGESVATGVSPSEVTGYLLAHGVYNAVLLDGGGSTEMDARLPGDTGLSVLNTPSDGSERPVANGLFVYSTAASAGPAVNVVVNGGKTVETVPGATIPVAAYATDALSNPAAAPPVATVVPASLGTWSDGQFTASRAGTGELIARDGRAWSEQRIDVVTKLDSLTVSPAQPDLNNGQAQQLTLSATASNGSPVQIPPQAATWSVADSSLGAVSAGGLFTAASSGGGLTNVTATVGGQSATASVSVGSIPAVIDDMSDISNWSMSVHNGATATMTQAPGVVPPGDTASGSMQFSYDFPAGSGVKQVVFWPNSGDEVTANADGQDPTGVGLWIKGAGTGPELAESYLDVDGKATTLYPTTITWQGWQFVICQLPAGMNFPLSIGFLDLLTISNTTDYKATINIADLEALYPPRPPATSAYVAIPKNPSWLQYEESSTAFAKGGATVLAGGGADLLAADPGSAGANVIAAIAKRLPALAPQAQPNVVQGLGNVSGDGLVPDLQYAQSELASLGSATHDAVGSGEITAGANAENGNFAQVLGDTHYAYTDGAANVIVTDSAHGGLLASDAYQVPAVTSQYPWLVQQLSDNTSPVVAVATQEPAYDPHSPATTQFTDRWEAQMYLQLIERYQQTHRNVHVVMLNGGARGFAEQILSPQGQVVSPGQGIPQLTVADLGVPASAPADQGGFPHFALLHVTPQGDLQFTVEPVLASIAITAPSGPLTAGTSQPLTATGTTVGGDNSPATTLPIADPASHAWSSSDATVASVNPDTGIVKARRPGTATISVTSGGITASVTVTVSR